MTGHLTAYTIADQPGGIPADRDRSLDRAHRLRRTVVATSVAATLGVAAVVGTGVGQSASTVASSTTTSSGSSQSSTRSSSAGTAPSLLAGSGTSHASSSGS